MSKGSSEAVRVVVRMRPFNSREKGLKCTRVVDVQPPDQQITITRRDGNPDTEGKTFKYDAVYDWDSTQRAVYDETAMPLVESVMEGFNGTIFAYGQTGCGKTFTMEGFPDPPELRGIIPNAFDHIFEIIASDTSGKKYLVRALYLEIYNEEIRDLLGSNPTAKLELKEDPQKGVFVKDLTSAVVKSSEEIDAVMKAGSVNRTTGATLMNAVSSRSHSIFTVIVERSETVGENKDGKKARDSVRRGKLNLVDLAGSERQSKTQASGQRLKEATKINLSLSALGNVISALVDGKSSHIPYRDSRLTRLLQDSLGGNTKTVMVAAISPADNNYDETLSTLRYAHRAKNIKNKPKINEDPKDALLREFQEEIARLRAALATGGGGGAALFQTVAKTVVASTAATTAAPAVTVVEQHASDGAPIMTAADIMKQQEEMSARIAEVEKLRKAKEELEEQSHGLQEMAHAQKEELEKKRVDVEARQAELMKREIEVEDERKKRQEAQDKAMSIEEVLKSRQDMFSEAEERIRAAEAAKLLERRRTRRAKYLIRQHEKEKEQETEYVEEQMAMVEDDLIATKQKLDAANKLIRRLKKHTTAQEHEIDDLQIEFEREREGLLDNIRDQQREMSLLEQITDLYVPPKMMTRIEERARWDEDRGAWIIPTSCMPQHRIGDGDRITLPGVPPSPNPRSGAVARLSIDSGRSHSAMPMRPSTADGRKTSRTSLAQSDATPVQLLVEEKTRSRRDSVSSLSGPLINRTPRGPPTPHTAFSVDNKRGREASSGTPPPSGPPSRFAASVMSTLSDAPPLN